MGYRDYSTAKGHLVDATGHGDFTTISAAITAASSGQTIFIRPGTYIENVALKAGVNLTAFGSDGLTTRLGSGTPTSNVTIQGSVTASFTGNVTLFGLQLKTNGAAALIISGSGASEIFLTNCTVNANDATGMTFNSTTCFSTFTNCYFISSGANQLFDNAAGTIDFEFCIFALSPTGIPSNNSTTNILFHSCDMLGFNISGTGTIMVIACHWLYGGNTLLTTSGSGTSSIVHSWLSSDTASAVSIGAGTTVIMDCVEVLSSNTNAITGAGTLQYGRISFHSGSSTINTTTQTAMPARIGISGSSGQLLQSQGNNANPAYTTATYPGTTSANQLLYSSATNTVSGLTGANNGTLITNNTGVPSWLANSGTPGFVLTANSGAPPSWQANGTGNVAGPGSSTNLALVTWDGTAGNSLLNNSTTLSSLGAMALPATGSVQFGSGTPLANYVESTFTPGISFGGGTTGITYSQQIGKYTQIGDVVFFVCDITLTNKGSSTGTARVTGLPVTNGATATTITAVLFTNITLTVLYTNVAIQVNGFTTADINQVGSAQANAAITDTGFANTSGVFLSGFYYTT